MKKLKQNKNNYGMSIKSLTFLLLVSVLSVGCGSKKVDVQDQTQVATQEVGQRVSELEGRMLALSLQVQSNQERVYEVRNRAGKKTGMTAHPTLAVATTQPPTPNLAPPSTAKNTRVVAPKKPMTHVPVAQPLNKPNTAPLGQPASSPITPQVNSPKGSGYSLPPETAMYLPGDDGASKKTSVTGAPQMPPAGTPNLPPSTPLLPPTTSGISANNTGVLIAHASIPAAQPYTPPATPQLSTKSTPGEQAAYKQALDLVMRGQAQAGREGLQSFLQNHPQSKLAPNAYYWVGESYYSQGNYNDALLAFRQVTTNYPKHHKTSDALLKAGMTYQRLGDVENAKAQYETLMTNFPRTNAAKIAKSKRL